MNIRPILYLFLATIINGCGGGEDGSNNNNNTPFELSCSDAPAFTPSASPVSYTGTGTPTTTAIVLHGKSGSPNGAHLLPLYTDLQAAGYNIKSLYMPWGHNGGYPSNNNWNGTLCQAMNDISSVVQAEKNAGNNVVLIGHSMGGAGSLIYNATTTVNQVDATITIAPGHFLHKSNTIQQTSAASVTTAKSMVAAGNGDSYATFQTRNNGTTQDIDTTANIFLSYHDLEQYPDIVNDVLAENQGPLYWIGGDSDNLTTVYGYASLFNTHVPDNTDSTYQTLSGDHKSVVAAATQNIISWLQGVGL